MKFIGKHRNDLFKIMDKYGHDQQSFNYVKRRGRIYIMTAQAGIQFGYLRKKHTHLNPTTKQWEHGASFKVQVNQDKEIEISDWKEVVALFETWLTTSCG